MPDCVVFPWIYGLINSSCILFSLAVSAILFGSRLFYSPLKCMTPNPGVDEFCASHELFVPKRYIKHNDYAYENFDVNWLTKLPLMTVTLLVCMSALRFWWTSYMVDEFVSAKRDFSSMTSDQIETSAALIIFRDGLWKYRIYLKSLYWRYVVVLLISIMILFGLYFMIESGIGCIYCNTIAQYVPYIVECRYTSYGVSGSYQYVQYLCVVIRADVLNVILWVFHPIAFCFTLLLILHLLILLSLNVPILSVPFILCVFRFKFSECVYVSRKYSTNEIFYFYLLRKNMCESYFNFITDELWFQHKIDH